MYAGDYRGVKVTAYKLVNGKKKKIGEWTKTPGAETSGGEGKARSDQVSRIRNNELVDNQPSARLKISPEKACKILKDGSLHGHPLTQAQRGMFGALCGQRKKPTRNEVSMSLTKWAQLITDNNCGTGAGGFKGGNTCAIGGGGKGGGGGKAGSSGAGGAGIPTGDRHEIFSTSPIGSVGPAGGTIHYGRHAKKGDMISLSGSEHVYEVVKTSGSKDNKSLTLRISKANGPVGVAMQRGGTTSVKAPNKVEYLNAKDMQKGTRDVEVFGRKYTLGVVPS